MFETWFGRPFPHGCRQAIVILLLSSCLSESCIAQDALPAASILKNPTVGTNLKDFFSNRTPYEFWLTCLLGTFGLAIIYGLLFGLKRAPNVRSEDITRPIIVVTVITGTLMLITVGYNNEQIAPAFGLFGTIVGYMLGRISQPQQPSNSQSDPPPN